MAGEDWFGARPAGGRCGGRDLGVWVHYLTAVFFDMIAAGFRACF
jgi:hypothetical protein